VFNDVLILNYGDILLVNPSLMTSFLTFSDKFTEVPLNEDTVNHYIHHRHTGEKPTYDGPVHFLKKCFAYPEVLSELINNINSENHIHPEFREAVYFSLLSIFNTNPALINFLSSGIPTFSGKVRNILLSDISRQWKLRDISEYVYMSESLIKKKLLSENTCFSKILLEVRMFSARNLLEQKYSVKHVAEKCGYSSTSYFVYLFRQHFNITPRQFTMKCSSGKTDSLHPV
ncbi:AraC family transcriptional regulator, partial [Escherichia coli]|nr:AraC family transcriptional regulator [Escherichia coli]HAP0230312.1 AraC family transcriptional regulator [Escherichia coli]